MDVRDIYELIIVGLVVINLLFLVVLSITTRKKKKEVNKDAEYVCA